MAPSSAPTPLALGTHTGELSEFCSKESVGQSSFLCNHDCGHTAQNIKRAAPLSSHIRFDRKMAKLDVARH